jgi:HIT domain
VPDDVYEDPDIVAFLGLYPTLLGHCIVAPKQHVEDWVHDLSEDQFSRLQVVVQRVARAVAATVPTAIGLPDCDVRATRVPEQTRGRIPRSWGAGKSAPPGGGNPIAPLAA